MAMGFINKTTTEGIETISLIEELIEKNKLSKAKQLCKSQADKTSNDPKILLLLSKIAIKEADTDTAMQFLFTALKEAPRDQKIQLELAKLLYSARGSYPEAAQAALNILRQINAADCSGSAQLLLAKIFTDSNYLEEAINNIKNALISNPKDEQAYIQWAKVLIKEGKNTEAFQKLEQALYLNPHLSEAYFLLSEISSFNDPKSKFLEQIRETLRHKKLSRQEKTFLNLALAKGLQDVKDYQTAFEHYIEANNQKNKDLNYDITKDEKLFDDLKKVFSRNVFNKTSTNENGKDLLFIISFPGSQDESYLKNLLENNKKLAYLGENSFLSQMFIGSRHSKDFINYIENFTRLDNDSLEIFRNHYLENVEKIVGEHTPLDNSKMNFMYLGLIKILFPKAKVIYLKEEKEEALFQTYTKLYEEESMNFSYNLKILNRFHNIFDQLMEYWLDLFPNEIEIVNPVRERIPAELLNKFKSHLNELTK